MDWTRLLRFLVRWNLKEVVSFVGKFARVGLDSFDSVVIAWVRVLLAPRCGYFMVLGTPARC
jgi:hypothetical protein